MDPNALKNAWTQWMSGLAQGGQGPAAQVYREWEQWVGQQFDKLARSETFLGQTAKALEGSFVLKSQFDRALEGSPWASKPIVPLRPSKSMSSPARSLLEQSA